MSRRVIAVSTDDIENRGSDAVPFGYVYFTGQSRVMFCSKQSGTGTVGPVDGWHATAQHIKAAAAVLAEKFPHMNWPGYPASQ